MAPLLPAVVAEIGPLEIAEFSCHYLMLALYTGLHTAGEALGETGGEARGEAVARGDGEVVGDALPPPPGDVSSEEFRRACRRDAWRYGSGLD
jgi:hypothetical protein